MRSTISGLINKRQLVLTFKQTIKFMKKKCMNSRSWHRSAGNLLKKMKLLIAFFFTGLIVVSANTYSQQTKLSLKFDEVTVKEVFKQIEEKSEFVFFYNEDYIDVYRKVSINAKEEKVEVILGELLKGTQNSYKVYDRQIVILSPEMKELPPVMKSESKTEQKKQISGRVTDSGGGIIPGVSVVIKGTTTGTITNAEGSYTLQVPNDAKVLLFSFVGMKTQEVFIPNGSIINVIMEEETIGIEEVVAVGYGSMKKSDLTASVASVKASEVTKAPSGSIEKLLQGRVSGLTIINNAEDNPQGGATVRVRGLSSINASNSPLIVVDGIPLGEAGTMNSVNPNIIESIEVLKDASGTAIYGSRGANGVIMITTKTGSGEKSSVWFSGKVGVGMFSKDLDYWRDPLKMAHLSNEAYENAGVEPLYVGKKDPNGTYYPSISEISNNEWPYYTDWSKYIFRTAITQDYNIGVQGGNDKSKYYVSLGYYNGEGVQIGDNYDKLSFDISYNSFISKILSVSTKAGFIRGNRNYNYGMDYSRNPLFPVYNGDGTYYKAYEQDYGNPIMMTNERKNISENMEGYSTLRFDWNILKVLKLSSTGNVRGGSSSSAVYNPPKYTYGGDLYDGEGSNSNNTFHSFIGDIYLTYEKLFSDIHHISAMAGTSLENSIFKGMGITARGFQNDVLRDENLAGAETKFVSNSKVETNLLSYFSRINYTLNSRYLFTLTTRADGSSKFGDNKKWAYFPSAAVSWKLSEESLIKNLNFFDQLKLRVSYGISGNQGISAYQTFEQFGSSFYYTGGKEQIIYGVGKEIGREGIGNRYVLWGGMANDDLGWEKTSQFDVGLDMTILKGKLDITFDYYTKRTTDLLRQKFLPPSAGYDRVWVNDGEVVNNGFEVSLNSRIITDGDWKFNAGFILNTNRNEVVAFGSKEESGYVEINGIKFLPYGNSMLSDPYLNVLALGYPMNSFFGYQVDGIIQEKPNNSNKMSQPGEFHYVGMNSDGTLNSNARTIIGNPNPKFTASLNLELRHKLGFDLSVLLYTAYGQDIFSTRKLESAKLQEQRWTPENPTNDRPSLRADRNYYVSSWFVEDGSFLRVQNISLGYTLPPKYAKKFASFRPYINISNPFTFSKVSEYDPEVGENGRGGVAYPRICSITTGVEIKF